MNNRFVLMVLGLIAGFFAQILGFVVYWLWFTRNNYWDLSYFYHTIFQSMNVVQIGTVSILFAMILFYFFNKKEFTYLTRGVVVSIIIGVIYLIAKTYF